MGWFTSTFTRSGDSHDDVDLGLLGVLITRHWAKLARLCGFPDMVSPDHRGMVIGARSLRDAEALRGLG